MKLPPDIRQMLDDLGGKVASPERRAVLTAIATDLAQLTARSLAGENVEQDLRHANAQGAMLAASEQELVRSAVLDWIGVVTRAIVGGALAAL